MEDSERVKDLEEQLQAARDDLEAQRLGAQELYDELSVKYGRVVGELAQARGQLASTQIALNDLQVRHNQQSDSATHWMLEAAAQQTRAERAEASVAAVRETLKRIYALLIGRPGPADDPDGFGCLYCEEACNMAQAALAAPDPGADILAAARAGQAALDAAPDSHSDACRIMVGGPCDCWQGKRQAALALGAVFGKGESDGSVH